MVAPGHRQVLPLPPEFIAPQDGAEKQDCERNAAKRWLGRHGATVAHLRPVYLGDDLFACQPIVAAIHDAGGNFILTCKPSSHKTNVALAVVGFAGGVVCNDLALCTRVLVLL